MIVPEGKEIWIGSKKYKAGSELPSTYILKEKKSQPVGSVKKDSVKKESENK